MILKLQYISQYAQNLKMSFVTSVKHRSGFLDRQRTLSDLQKKVIRNNARVATLQLIDKTS